MGGQPKEGLPFYPVPMSYPNQALILGMLGWRETGHDVDMAQQVKNNEFLKILILGIQSESGQGLASGYTSHISCPL